MTRKSDIRWILRGLEVGSFLVIIGHSKPNVCYICNMIRLEEIKKILEKLKPELKKKYHVRSIGLFGSIVRDDITPTSDIDIIVDFSQPIGIEFVDLGDLIEHKLNQKVDLVSRNGIKPKYFREIEAEIVYV